MTKDLHHLASEAKRRGRELGFDLVGIAPAQPSQYREYFRQWLDDGQAGTMAYLAARFEERTDPSVYLPGAQSVICVALNYFAPLEPPADAGSQGRIARYALGDDYHEIIKPRLHQLSDWLRQQAPEAQTRCAVDTAPVMEKELSARAGVGWIGKNTCLINQEIGSWLLLGEVLTTLALPADSPGIDRCGTCTRCLEACPTQALTPYRLDATKCISYLTIEHSGEIDPALQGKMGNWLYGCDICQEVCPWNRRAPWTNDPALGPRFPSGTVDLRETLAWTADDYRRTLRKSAMKRVKLPVLQRNAARILGAG
jgi:epoxyqueuosine reductase